MSVLGVGTPSLGSGASLEIMRIEILISKTQYILNFEYLHTDEVEFKVGGSYFCFKAESTYSYSMSKSEAKTIVTGGIFFLALNDNGEMVLNLIDASTSVPIPMAPGMNMVINGSVEVRNFSVNTGVNGGTAADGYDLNRNRTLRTLEMNRLNRTNSATTRDIILTEILKD